MDEPRRVAPISVAAPDANRQLIETIATPSSGAWRGPKRCGSARWWARVRATPAVSAKLAASGDPKRLVPSPPTRDEPCAR